MGRLILAHDECVARERLRITAIVLAVLCLGLAAGALAISRPRAMTPREMFPSLAPELPPPGSCTSGAMCNDPEKIPPSEEIPDVPSIILPSASAGTTTILFVGDMMFDRTVATRSRKDLAYPFSMVKNDPRFLNVDYRVGNLEGPLTAKRRPPEKEIDFVFDPALGGVLKSMGFHALSQANNHQLDQGREGAEDSKMTLTASGIVSFGDQVRDDVDSAKVQVEIEGIRVAFLGFNITDNPLDKVAAEDALARANASADLVIVFPHWGEEYESKPRQSVRELAYWFIDHGADAVIGAHPHWMQSIDLYRGKPITYSLGNFVFDQDWSRETNEGLAVVLELGKDSRSLILHPIRQERSQPRFLSGNDLTDRLKYLAEISDPVLTKSILEGRIPLSIE